MSASQLRRSLTLNQQIRVGTLAILAIVAVILGAGLWTVSRTEGAVHRATADAWPAGVLLLNADRDGYQAQLALERAVVTSDGETRAKAVASWAENRDQIVDRFSKYQALASPTPSEASSAAELIRLRTAWVIRGDAMAELLRRGEPVPPPSVSALQAAFSVQREALDAHYGRFYETTSEELSDEVVGTLRVANLFLAAAAVTLLTTVILLARLALSALKPLNRVILAAREVANGELQPSLPHGDIDDEIGALIRAFRGLTGFLAHEATLMEAIGRGDLSQTVTVRGPRDRLGTATQAMATNLANVMQQLQGAAEAASASSGSLSAASHMLTRSTGSAAEQARSLAEATERSGTTTRQLSADAVSVASGSRNAQARSAAATQSMARLESSSREIGRIIKLIASIAEQTNTLALNASVEAARAGSAGRALRRRGRGGQEPGQAERRGGSAGASARRVGAERHRCGRRGDAGSRVVDRRHRRGVGAHGTRRRIAGRVHARHRAERRRGDDHHGAVAHRDRPRRTGLRSPP